MNRQSVAGYTLSEPELQWCQWSDGTGPPVEGAPAVDENVCIGHADVL